MKNIITLLSQKIQQDSFLKNNIIFFIGSTFGSFLNYLYHPILSRMMSVEDFGEVQALVSLFLQSVIFLGMFGGIVINIVSNHEELAGKLPTIAKLQRIAFYSTLVVFVLIVAFKGQLSDSLQFTSFYPFISLAVLIVINVFYTFRTAYLQGRHEFQTYANSQIILAGAKLFFAIVLVYFGFRSFGAISGLILAQLLAFYYIYQKTRQKFNTRHTGSLKIDSETRNELKYGTIFLLTMLSLSFFYTSDIIIIKTLFSPRDAGLYSGISTIARIIFFGTGPIAAVLLPSIKLKNALKENNRMLLKALMIVGLAGGAVLILFSLFPEFVTGTLIGHQYTAFAPLLWKTSLLLFLVSLTNVFFSYYLALRRYYITLIAIGGVAITIMSTVLSHRSIGNVVDNFIIGMSFIFILTSFIAFQQYFRTQKI